MWVHRKNLFLEEWQYEGGGVKKSYHIIIGISASERNWTCRNSPTNGEKMEKSLTWKFNGL